ncbi:hypothetical protein GCM10023168_03270 [Fodinibacter luteus]|uniref:Cardiolipin synthase N-terminal domain-containing protein n=1 Tax=Fodinibacter luteus TaxID=552064 RepID=A0ABP8JYG0_9MICO
MDFPLWIIGLAVAVAIGFFCYRTAEAKGRNPIGYGLLGLFLPLVGLIVVLVMKPQAQISTTGA